MKRRKLKIIVYILIILVLAFIWGNSTLSKSDSSDQSLSIMNFIKPLLEIFLGEGNVTHHFVRKLAHFTEFFVLGGLLAILMLLYNRRGWQDVITCLFAGLLTAVIDETIQIFAERGSQVQDVLLDFSGAFLGTVFIFVLDIIVTLIRKRQRNTR